MDIERHIFITGASGFLGRQIVRKFNSKDKIYCLKNKSSVLPETTESNFREVSLDELKSLENITHILHCAGKIKGSKEDLFESNVELTKKIIEVTKQFNAKLLFISSINAGLSVRDTYANTKLEAEIKIQSSKLQALILRPSYLFGDGEEPNIAKISSLFGRCHVFLSFPFSSLLQPLHVEEFADICIDKLSESNWDNKVIEIAGALERESLEMIYLYIKSQSVNPLKIRFPSFLKPVFRIVLGRRIDVFFQDKTLRALANLGNTQIQGLKSQNF